MYAKMRWSGTAAMVMVCIFVAACDNNGAGSQPATTQSTPGAVTQISSGSTATQGAALVQDRASLITTLQQAGAKVSSESAIQQPFLSVSGQNLSVNGQSVQTFEYATSAAMAADAGKVGPDGSIPTMMITWIAQPHFYKAGRLLVIYPGNDGSTLAALKAALGDPFATGAKVVGTPMIIP